MLLLLISVAALPGVVRAKEPSLPAASEHIPLVIIENLKPLNAVGDPLPRIQCQNNYTATIYAEGLIGPDGLAFSPTGTLYVAEETAGRVSRIEPDGSATPVLSGLNSPEGIAFDDQGNLYVVEDIENGRLIKRATDGLTTTLATNLDAPEGVVWATDGPVYVTESNVQFASSPAFYKTQVTAVSASGVTTSIRIDSLFWSYAGITIGSDGLLYITNEASGIGTNDSVFTVNPNTGQRVLFTSGLIAPEGLRFSNNAQFPLYVAEEDIDGNGHGRLSQVQADGSHSPFCTGFGNIEDVVLDNNGGFFVSEDSTGLIILIAPKRIESVAISGPTTGAINVAHTFTAAVSPTEVSTPIDYTWSPEPLSGQGTSIAEYTWTITGPQTISVTAQNPGGQATISHTITISASAPEPPPCQAVTEINIEGPEAGIIETTYSFTGVIKPITATATLPLTYTLPITYTWSPEPLSGQGTPTAGYNWPITGTQMISLAAYNCGPASVTDVHTIIITAPEPAPTPIESIVISGPVTGLVNTAYTFTVSISPSEASLPITYTWSPEPESGQSTPLVTYTWSMTGSQIIKVTLQNTAGLISTSHTINLFSQPSPPYLPLYLPLILKT
jgi:sugar lactone lactonase YvrE